MRIVIPTTLLLLGAACAAAPTASPSVGPAASAASTSTITLGQSDPARPHCFLSPEGDRICPTMGQAIVYDEAAAAQMAARTQDGATEVDVAEDDGEARGAGPAPGSD